MHHLFGEPSLPEDTVYYHIYQVPEEAPPAPTASNAPAEAALPAAAEEWLTRIQALIAPWVDDYLWHREALALHCPTPNSTSSGLRPAVGASTTPPPLQQLTRPLLQGATAFGDCLEDEWFIVFLLQRITETFPTLAATVYDTDGQFLLIEAAEVIPSWITPDNSVNRVFLYRGNLHIVPPAVTGQSSVPESAVLYGSLRSLADCPARSLADAPLQQLALARIVNYPATIQETNRFRTRCYVPHRVAHLLHHNPQLLASAIEAFYLRHPAAVSACRDMHQFSPEDRSGGCVLTTVRWSRTLYAQTRSQRFVAPRVFDRAVPAESATDASPGPRPSEIELGMKIACGFEMLCSGYDLADPLLPDTVAQQAEAVRAAESWDRYRARLEQAGYFDGYRSGSEGFRAKTAAARREFQLAHKTDARPILTGGGGGPAADPLERTHRVLRDIIEILQRPLVPTATLARHLIGQDDSDDWMYIRPDYLESILQKQQANLDQLHAETPADPTDRRATAIPSDSEMQEGVDMADMIAKFQQFMGKDAGMDGAEFWSESSDGETNDDSDSENDDEEEDRDAGSEIGEEDFRSATTTTKSRAPPLKTAPLSAAPIQFDPEAFLTSLESILGVPLAQDPVHPTSDGTQAGKQVRFAEPATQKGEAADGEDTLEEIMEAMDYELGQTKIGASFERVGVDDQGSRSTAGANEGPVDIDLNLVKNILQSFKAQEGLPGPMGNLLGGMNIYLPPHQDSDDDAEADTDGK
ncbi:hypothetical protein H4R33_001389 [Dimargaris cristalligena]|nr:hypothetical protein H4R33_001389 [Dimargaris cristalligena]